MLNRLIFNRIGAVIIGLIVLGVGFYMFSAKSVMCGDEVMSRGDICVTTSNGSSVERDYDEQKADNATTSYVAMGVGGLILVGGIVANIRHFTKKKPEETVPATPATPAGPPTPPAAA
jgi:hypothetical protein